MRSVGHEGSLRGKFEIAFDGAISAIRPGGRAARSERIGKHPQDLLLHLLWPTFSTQRKSKHYLKKVPEWELDKKRIERTFEFDDFTGAIDFVNLVAEISEEQEHHPDIDIRYNKVKLSIYTHDKNGLTELDFQLAERIDTLSEE